MLHKTNRLIRFLFFLLFLGLLYSQAVYYIVGLIRQEVLREAANERALQSAPDSTLIAIRPGEEGNALKWERPGKEFLLHGSMYDVVRIRSINGQQVCYCTDDRLEDILLEKINRLTKSNNQPSGKSMGFPTSKLVCHEWPALPRIAACPTAPGSRPAREGLEQLPLPLSSLASPPPRA